jgi:putative restriction endonuclease
MDLTPAPQVLRLLAIKTWQRHGQRAVHKPLLLLDALGRYAQGGPRLIAFAEFALDLPAMAALIGQGSANFHVEMPFWRMQTDGIWEVEQAATLKPNGSGDVAAKVLLTRGIRGGLIEPLYDDFRANPALLQDAALALLQEFFHPNEHGRLLRAIGLWC